MNNAHLHTHTPDKVNVETLHHEVFKKAQRQDKDIHEIFTNISNESTSDFIKDENGVIKHKKVMKTGNPKYRVVLPRTYEEKTLTDIHSILHENRKKFFIKKRKEKIQNITSNCTIRGIQFRKSKHLYTTAPLKVFVCPAVMDVLLTYKLMP